MLSYFPAAILYYLIAIFRIHEEALKFYFPLEALEYVWMWAIN